MENRVRYQYAILPGVLLLILLMGLPTLFLPFGRDQGFFSVVAGAANDGGDIYRDAWDIKPPMIYWTYALAQELFGKSMMAAHLADLTCVLITAFLLFLLMNRLFPPAAGVMAALVYGLWYFLRTDYWSLAQAEGFMGMWLVAAAFFFIVSAQDGRRSLALLGGACIGYAFLYKTTALLFSLSSPFLILLLSENRAIRQSIGLIAASAAGFFLACLSVVAFYSLSGSPGPLLDVFTVVIPGYMKLPAVGNRDFFPSNLHFFASQWWMTAFALIGLIAGVLRGRIRQTLALVGLAILVLVGVWLQRKYFLYHWVITFGFISCLVGLGLHQLTAWSFKRSRLAGLFAACLAMSILVAGTLPMMKKHYQQTKLVWMEQTGRIDRLTFEKHFGDPIQGDFYLPRVTELASWLKKATPPDTPIYLWGFDPLLYFLADRPPASRFIGTPHIYSEWAPRHWRAELTQSLKQKEPAFFIVDVEHDFYWVTGNHLTGMEAIKEFPKVMAMLKEVYEEKTDFGPYRIFARKRPSGPGPL